MYYYVVMIDADGAHLEFSYDNLEEASYFADECARHIENDFDSIRVDIRERNGQTS